jgi:hypothetical protein
LPEEFVRVIFKQTGGFAGLARGCELDVDQLPAEEAARIRALVGQLPSAEPAPPPAQARDLAHCEITVEEGGTSRHFTATDVTVPDPVRPLIQLLQKHARPLPRR